MNSKNTPGIKITNLDSYEMYTLARMYEHGTMVERDLHKAAELYILAAKNGSENAKKIFFFDFDEKENVNTNPKLVQIIKIAAELGYAEAQFSLGGRYRAGLGMNKNYEEAFHWISKAAKQGHVEARYYVGTMYRRGKGTDIDLTKADELTLKAAELGSAPAQHAIGKFLLGKSGKEAQALKWIQRSADNGYCIAQYDLGMFHLEGKLCPADSSVGLELLKQSGDNRYAPAAYKVAEIFEKGNYGVEKDMTEAIRWYKKAHKIGYAGADLRLAKIYQNGEGVERDLLKCINYYKQADRLGWHYAKQMMMEIFAN